MTLAVFFRKTRTAFTLLKQLGLYEFLRYLMFYNVQKQFTTKANRLLEEPSAPLDTNNLKIAVYTCIVGHYDSLLEPSCTDPDIDYYVFTDMACPEDSRWKKIDITQFKEYNQLTPTQLNRKIKMLPHRFLPSYDYTIYVDGNIEIKTPMMPLIQEMGHHPLGVHYHRGRDCIYDEIRKIRYLRKTDLPMARKQVKAYRKEGFPRHHGLYENPILIRKHADEETSELMEAWWSEFKKYPTRDQLSLPYLIWKLNYDKKNIHILGMNLYENPSFKKHRTHK